MNRLGKLVTFLILIGSLGLAQPPFPNLDTLTNFPNPSGTTCKLSGAAASNTEKGKLNALKNRYKPPADGTFSPITFADLFALPQGHISGNKVVGFPGSGDT